MNINGIIVGAVFAGTSLFVANQLGTIILGAAAFSCFWGIYEIIAQEKRVLKGWFPENPKRSGYYARLAELLASGNYACHHSAAYEAAYHPQYRIILKDLLDLPY